MGNAVLGTTWRRNIVTLQRTQRAAAHDTPLDVPEQPATLDTTRHEVGDACDCVIAIARSRSRTRSSLDFQLLCVDLSFQIEPTLAEPNLLATRGATLGRALQARERPEHGIVFGFFATPRELGRNNAGEIDGKHHPCTRCAEADPDRPGCIPLRRQGGDQTRRRCLHRLAVRT